MWTLNSLFISSIGFRNEAASAVLPTVMFCFQSFETIYISITNNLSQYYVVQSSLDKFGYILGILYRHAMNFSIIVLHISQANVLQQNVNQVQAFITQIFQMQSVCSCAELRARRYGSVF